MAPNGPAGWTVLMEYQDSPRPKAVSVPLSLGAPGQPEGLPAQRRGEARDVLIKGGELPVGSRNDDKDLESQRRESRTQEKSDSAENPWPQLHLIFR